MGRPEFEMIVANTPREEMLYTSLGGQSYSIPAGGSQSFMIYAPKGFLGTIEAIYLNAPAVAGATSGSHICSLGYQNISQARGISNYNKAVQYYCNEWSLADVGQNPSAGQPQYASLKDMIFDDVTAFRMTYVNQTNATFNGVIDFRVVARLRQVTK